MSTSAESLRPIPNPKIAIVRITNVITADDVKRTVVIKSIDDVDVDPAKQFLTLMPGSHQVLIEYTIDKLHNAKNDAEAVAFNIGTSARPGMQTNRRMNECTVEFEAGHVYKFVAREIEEIHLDRVRRTDTEYAEIKRLGIEANEFEPKAAGSWTPVLVDNDSL